MKEVDTRNLFKEPVTDDIAPHYSRIITHPMDRETILTNFNNHHYARLKEMVVRVPFTTPMLWMTSAQADFEQMFENCMMYNTEDSMQYKVQMRAMLDLCSANHLHTLTYNTFTGSSTSARSDV
jgi:bromodomain-containing protein 7/9